MKLSITVLVLACVVFTGIGQNIQSTISYINNLPEADRQSAVDSFMVVLEPHGFPYVHVDTACFIYQGPENSVNLAGGFTNWQWGSIDMSSISGTDFWYYYRTFAMDAHLAYKYILNDEIWIVDPLNPNTLGQDCELFMPNYIHPWEIEEIPGTPSGTLESFSISSEYTGSTYQVKVYLPNNYNNNRVDGYPTAYFQDGFDYLGIGKADVVLDNLINAGIIDSLIAVFIHPNDRIEEYAGILRYHYMGFFADELVSYIDENYNTIQNPMGRAVCGKSLGGNISVLISYNHPEIFGNCGIHSGAFPAPDYEAYYIVANGPKLDIKWVSLWGFYDYLHENLLDFKDVLLLKDYDLHWSTYPEGHNMGLWRATLDELLSFFFPPGFSVVPENNTGLISALEVIPNPVVNLSSIEYILIRPSDVNITIYDIQGIAIERSISETLNPGKHKFEWNAEGVNAGIYFCVFKTNSAYVNQVVKILKL